MHEGDIEDYKRELIEMINSIDNYKLVIFLHRYTSGMIDAVNGEKKEG